MHVHNEADGLKGVKRDAQRQHPILEIPVLEALVNGASGPQIGHEIGILEGGKQQDVEGQTQDKPGLALSFAASDHEGGDPMIDKDGGDEHADHLFGKPGVHRQAEGQQQRLANPWPCRAMGCQGLPG